MKNVQHHDALLEQAIDIRAARTLCRDGWSCKQINAVLKNTKISAQEFVDMQTQSRELDKLQNVFGSPDDSLAVGHAEPNQSELDFLNRGPDAAVAVLKEKGWNNYEISLVIQESMFASLDEPTVDWPEQQQPGEIAGHGAAIPPQTAPPSHSYPPPHSYNQGPRAAAISNISTPGLASNRRAPHRRSALQNFGRDVFILAFMAGLALALLFTLL